MNEVSKSCSNNARIDTKEMRCICDKGKTFCD